MRANEAKARRAGGTESGASAHIRKLESMIGLISTVYSHILLIFGTYVSMFKHIWTTYGHIRTIYGRYMVTWNTLSSSSLLRFWYQNGANLTSPITRWGPG